METQSIEIEKILVADNYRKAFAEDSLQELAESIRQHGLIQPITVRPHTTQEGCYELVVGERRLRASKLAEKEQITAFIRSLTDEEAREIRLIENIQREDVHPIAEARGLLQLVQDGKKPRYIAQKLGKTEKHIHQRLSLNQLNAYWQQLFLDGGIYLQGALTIARLSKANQLQLQKAYPRERIEKDGKLISTYISSQLDDYIRRNFFLALHTTDFPKQDPDLYPKAGACLSCKKRTGCNKMLFAEIDKEDFCMDAACFNEKNQRHLSAQMRLLAEENIPFRKIVTRYGYSSEKGVLRSYEYTIIENPEEVTEECHKAVVVEGEQLGKIVTIRLRETNPKPASNPEEEKARRRETIRQNKIRRLLKRSAATAILDQLRGDIDPMRTPNEGTEPTLPVVGAPVSGPTQRLLVGGETCSKLLEYFILDRMRNQSKAFFGHFAERYQWQTPVDTSDYYNKSSQIAANVLATPLERKLEMFLDLFIEPMVSNEYSTQEVELAKRIGIDTEALTQQAAQEVDAGRKGKRQAANTGLSVGHEPTQTAAPVDNYPPEEAAA